MITNDRRVVFDVVARVVFAETAWVVKVDRVSACIMVECGARAPRPRDSRARADRARPSFASHRGSLERYVRSRDLVFSGVAIKKTDPRARDDVASFLSYYSALRRDVRWKK